MNKKISSENSLLTFLSLFFLLIPIFFMGLFSYVNRTYSNFTEEEKWKKYYSYFPQFIANHLNLIIFIFAIISFIFAIIVGLKKPSTIQKVLITIIIFTDIVVSLVNLGSMM
jgi:hypothetical protein